MLTGARFLRNAATSTTDQEALAAILGATNWSEREIYQALSDAGVTTSNEATALAQLQSMIEQQQQAGEYNNYMTAAQGVNEAGLRDLSPCRGRSTC